MPVKAGLAALLVVLFAAPSAAAQMPGGAPQAPAGALHRYYSSSTNTHWVTPTPVGGDFAYERTLGFLLTTAGPGRTAIYGCRSGGADYFLSTDAGCEGTTPLGVYGWAESARPSVPSVPLYRCVRPGIGHFATDDAGCEGFTNEGRLGYLRARTPALARYNNGSDHLVTSGVPSAGFALEIGMGFLLQESGGNRSALYECRSGADTFLSLDQGCEGSAEQGLSGYVYATPTPDEETSPLYRCRIGSERFASSDPGCEGQVVEGLLGYTRRTQELLNRAYSPSTATHWVTSGAVPPGWFQEFSLGYVLTRSGSDRQAFYGCLAGTADQFLSLDPGCEGRTQLGRQGYLYTNPPAGVATAPLYRCLRPGIGHFASLDPACEGHTREQELGRLRTESPEPPPEPLRLTCTPSAARVTASARGRSLRRIRYGGRETIAGIARNGGGSPAAGATVVILIGNRKPTVFAQTVAGPNGRYRVRVRPGKNRIFHAGFRPTPEAADLACSRRVRVHVKAGLTLRATKRVRRGGRVRFRGRLLGKPIPRVGKLIDLQAFDAGRWRTFKTTRAKRTGRYRASYRFLRTTAPRTFRFRARARREARYPYALGTSRVVRVRVR